MGEMARKLTRYSGDPWNQTAADNAEWLMRFKRDAGLLDTAGPGLGEADCWAVEQGGTGFAPPYAIPRASREGFQANFSVTVRKGAKSLPAAVANSYIEGLSSLEARPAAVFCSRELERGLVDYIEEYVSDTGRMPSDAMIQAKGRRILSTDKTPAEDPVLLEQFKEMVAKKLPNAGPANESLADAPAMPSNMDVNISDEDINNILQDMNFEFDTHDFDDVTMEGLQETGGVSLNKAGI